MPTQTTFKDARQTVNLLVLVRVAITILGLIVLTGYMMLVFGYDFFQPHWYDMFVSIVVGFAIGLVLTLARIFRVFRFFQQENTEPPSDDVVRDSLNAPLSIAIIDLVSWAIAGSAFCLYLIHAHPEQTQRMLVHGLVSNLYTGNLVAIGNFYFFEQIMARKHWPYLLQERHVSSVPGVIPVPFYARIGAFILTASIFPAVFIGLIEYVGDGSGTVLFFTISSTIFCAVFQGTFLLLTISRPLGLMAGMFDRLSRSLDVRQMRIYRADAIGRFAEMFDDLVTTIQERDFIRSTFGRYMSQQVVDKILDGEIELGGSHYEATVLFADIRGFTALSESMPPEDVVEFLNEYLEHMVQAITSHHGIPDKFIGDGILAIWGVPEERSDHANLAVQAALEMIEALNIFNQGREGDPIQIGIGIHSGDLIAGNIGSKKKMEFTVIGDTVNTCSRVEALNKELGSTLAITDKVYAQLAEGEKEHFPQSQQVSLRGKTTEIVIYTR